MTHAHITSWVIALILFVIALYLHRSGKEKGFKIVQMILRVFYILIFITGGLLLHSIVVDKFYVLKALVGLWVIASLELVLVRLKKGKNMGPFWIQLIISLAVVLYLGYYLPL